MENKDWLNEYVSLKQVNPGNPFTVPAGYFDSLAERIVSIKKLEVLKGKDALGGFTVPENYFDELAGNIQSRIVIENFAGLTNDGFIVPDGYFDELAGNIESRVNVAQFVGEKEQGFIVPEGYFDELAGNIKSRVAVESFINDHTANFSVPDGYFENLAQQIQSRIFVEEALAGQEEAFAVPDGYFEKLNKAVLDKTVNAGTVTKNASKGIVVRMFASTAFKYATAACFALAIGGGILISQLTAPDYVHRHSFLHKELSTVPVDEIKDYLQLNVDAGDTQQTVNSTNVAVDDKSLRDALTNDIDSVQ